jgi:hypothetical protein
MPNEEQRFRGGLCIAPAPYLDVGGSGDVERVGAAPRRGCRRQVQWNSVPLCGTHGEVDVRWEVGGAGRDRPWQTSRVDDDDLLTRAEQALTEIKVNQGLSEEHAAVLAALRIRLHGSAGKSLEEMLAASEERPDSLEAKIEEAERSPKPSLDDLLSEPDPKPDWPA